MVPPTDEVLDGVSESSKYPDGTVVRVFCMRTTRKAYPSGWAYKLHYGTTEPNPPHTLGDGTIRRYDNSHEDTKGHELHVAPNSEPRTLEFPAWSNSGRGSGTKSRKTSSRSSETNTTVIS